MKTEQRLAAGRAAAVRDICEIAGRPGLAEHYIASGMSPREVTAELARQNRAVNALASAVDRQATRVQ